MNTVVQYSRGSGMREKRDVELDVSFHRLRVLLSCLCSSYSFASTVNIQTVVAHVRWLVQDGADRWVGKRMCAARSFDLYIYIYIECSIYISIYSYIYIRSGVYFISVSMVYACV